MKFTKLLSLSLVLFTLFGCNKPPSANQVINPIEAETTPQEENSTPPVATNNQPPKVSQTRNTSPQRVARVETTTQTQNNSPQRVKRVETTTPIQNTSPQIVAQKQTSSKYGTLEELNAKIKKRNGRIIGSATCDDDGLENDVRVDFNGDGMPDECVTANLKMHPLFSEETLDGVTSFLNYLEKGSQTTSRKEGNYNYYLWKKDGKIVKAIKSEKNSASSVHYWFYDGKPIAVFQVDDNGSSITNKYFIYYENGKLSSIIELFGPEMNNSRTILEFNNQQLQDAKSLLNGYKEIFNVFGAD
ncbi:hypothetical protein [Rivularia sp. PCC 7116]|uniref:hypothetical protein n=1 Tax=Rivularia sp. PCC 7116 TaxID=373994 RepID=UPI0002E8FE0F|nr:hypothetical protein [Rivularia sp. PCC 7116]